MGDRRKVPVAWAVSLLIIKNISLGLNTVKWLGRGRVCISALLNPQNLSR